MRKVYIHLTQLQVEQLEEARKGLKKFGLISQPLVFKEVMPVLVLNEKECRRYGKFISKFVPKRYRNV